ncbi:MAG: DUF59 domain-containing protein [Chitinophagaceae bacterium]|nr:MAG: DUF59 domain-containing protein [Chitinophagaceae bacterium]
MTIATVIDRLRTVFDPEIPVNVYDLGLIYDVQLIAADIYVVMTLTTATCPAAAFLPEEVRAALESIPGVGTVHVEVTYEPRWKQERMSTEARTQLGF